MSEKEVRPYGLWESPLSPRWLTESLRLNDVQWSGDRVAWEEGRGGRHLVVLTREGDAARDAFATYSIRGGVGYGGGSFGVGPKTLYFVAQDRVFRQDLEGGEPRPITPRFGHAASPTPSPDGRWLLFVHTYEGEDTLALVDTEGRHWPQKLATGADFYMQPAWHPQRPLVAWVEWDHPNMPWDGTRVYVGRVEGEPPRLVERRLVAGGDDIPVFQPEFSPDGRFLSYIIGDGEWDRLELYDLETGERISLLEGEGMVLAAPAWVQGLRTYAWTPDGKGIYARRNDRGIATLLHVRVDSRTVTEVEMGPYTWFDQPAVSPVTGRLALIASSSRISPRIVTWGEGGWRVIRRSTPENIPLADLSEPVPIHWHAPDGTTVHGLYYPPTNSRFTGRGLPPAIVNVHGGPTSQRVANFNADVQFFTSRGWAVLEVNYRGSTGYGRSYMNALKGHWGEYDVEDVVSAAHALVEQKLAHPEKLVVKGGSAGGYTVLNVLIRHPGLFKAGICLYGVTDLFSLAMDTHKFEAHYTDTLVGPLPEAAARYREWSPLFHADRIRDPVAIFQGAEDKVVPPDQAERLVEVLRRNRVPHLYRLYEGEGHGWRKPETIEAYYSDVLTFLKVHVLFA